MATAPVRKVRRRRLGFQSVDPGVGDLEQAAAPLDHHRARLGEGGADEGDVERLMGLMGTRTFSRKGTCPLPLRLRGDPRGEPFGAGQRLAEAAAGHQHPGPPGQAGGGERVRLLALVRPAGPVEIRVHRLVVAQRPDEPAMLRRVQVADPVEIGVRHHTGPASFVPSANPPVRPERSAERVVEGRRHRV